jgi:hypothetical protein
MTTATYNHSGFTRVVIHFVLIAFTAGCTTMQPVYRMDAERVSAQIKVGEIIKITRKDWRSTKFRVTEISDDGIIGYANFVRFSDIQQVQLQNGKIIGGNTNRNWSRLGRFDGTGISLPNIVLPPLSF